MGNQLLFTLIFDGSQQGMHSSACKQVEETCDSSSLQSLRPPGVQLETPSHPAAPGRHYVLWQTEDQVFSSRRHLAGNRWKRNTEYPDWNKNAITPAGRVLHGSPPARSFAVPKPQKSQETCGNLQRHCSPSASS